MNINGSTYVNGSWWTEGARRTELDRWALMDVERKLINVGWNCDGQQQMAMLMELWGKTMNDRQQ